MHRGIEKALEPAFTERLKDTRELKKISQLAMAKKIGIARQTYLDLESGKTSPKVSMLIAIARILNRDPMWMIGLEDCEERYCIRCEKTKILLGSMAEIHNDNARKDSIHAG